MSLAGCRGTGGRGVAPDSGTDASVDVDIRREASLNRLDAGDQECSPPHTLCGGDCVDTSSEPRFCGSCERDCRADESCIGGVCAQSGDCRSGVPCVGLTYCNLATGTCDPGCASDAQCGATERCNPEERRCECRTGFHRCGDICVSDASTESCGPSCLRCELGTNARSVACQGGTCFLDCQDGYMDCDGTSATGCETDVRLDEDNCGTCGRICGWRCIFGSCSDGYTYSSCSDPGDCRAGQCASGMCTNRCIADNNCIRPFGGHDPICIDSVGLEGWCRPNCLDYNCGAYWALHCECYGRMDGPPCYCEQ